MEAVGQLAGGIAHDFNNLLGVIMGYCDLLEGQIAPEDSKRRMVEHIHHAGTRAAALTQQLLAFSRRQVLRPLVLDLNRLVTGMETMLRRLIGERIEIATSLLPDLGRVKADPTQIEQTLMNLAVNARDAMPGGGTITIETANVELDDSHAREHAEVKPGSYVMLAMSDTGVGMDSETLTHVFEPFFTTKQLGKGTGLGLSTVYGIVKQSGGYIYAYSEPGRGTTFKVYLPCVEGEAEVVKGEATLPILRRTGDGPVG
jgi:signal transduction histidine kinase